MSASDWFVLLLACAAIVGIALLNRWYAEFQAQTEWSRSAEQAARADQVDADIAAAKEARRQREIDQLYAMCPDVMRVTKFPTQIRRTEEDQ